MPIWTFAPKQKPAQPTTGTKSAELSRARPWPRQGSQQRTAGNQPAAPSPDADTARAAHDFSRVAVHAGPAAAERSVSHPADALEREADRVAEQVMRAGEVSPPGNREAVSPVERAVRAYLRTGRATDLTAVRLHTDGPAADAARSLHARAFTAGNDIYFGRHEYSPSTTEGRRLLAHELVHVFQQQESTDVANTLMRQPKSPAGGEELEIGTLRLRLAKLMEREAKEWMSSAERPILEHRLAVLEKVAAEPDPTRKKIVFLREQIRDLREQMKRATPSSARKQIGSQIQASERDLAQELRTRIAAVERELANLYKATDLSPATTQQIVTAETELRESEAELGTLSRIFTPQRAAAVGQIYTKEVRPDMSGHCMGAVYKGMEAIYTPKASTDIEAQVLADSAKILKQTKKDTNDVDRIMETLRQHSMAGDKKVIRYSQRRDAWEPSVEKTVLDMVSSEYPGWYFFGLSVSGGWHSVILAADNTEGKPRIYWMDQYSKGFTNEVTGKLDKKMKEIWLEPTYGFTDSTVWPLLPTADAVVEVK